MSDIEALKKQAWKAREHYIDALTDVAWRALKDAGLYLKHDGSDYNKLRDAIQFAREE